MSDGVLQEAFESGRRYLLESQGRTPEELAELPDIPDDVEVELYTMICDIWKLGSWAFCYGGLAIVYRCTQPGPLSQPNIILDLAVQSLLAKFDLISVAWMTGITSSVIFVPKALVTAAGAMCIFSAALSLSPAAADPLPTRCLQAYQRLDEQWSWSKALRWINLVAVLTSYTWLAVRLWGS